MIDKDVCIGCGTCVSVCPVGAIQLKNGKAEIDKNICIQCHTCEGVCPVSAINIE